MKKIELTECQQTLLRDILAMSLTDHQKTNVKDFRCITINSKPFLAEPADIARIEDVFKQLFQK